MELVIFQQLIFIVCTILLEKITGGPSGPLAIIYFFQKKHTQVRTENLVFWGPRSFQFDLEMNINIYYMHYIIKEDYWRP